MLIRLLRTYLVNYRTCIAAVILLEGIQTLAVIDRTQFPDPFLTFGLSASVLLGDRDGRIR